MPRCAQQPVVSLEGHRARLAVTQSEAYATRCTLHSCNRSSHMPVTSSAAPPALPVAYRAIACGADVNHSYSTQPAAQLVWEANLQAGGEADQPLSPTNLGHTNVLHAACRVSVREVSGLLGAALLCTPKPVSPLLSTSHCPCFSSGNLLMIPTGAGAGCSQTTLPRHCPPSPASHLASHPAPHPHCLPLGLHQFLSPSVGRPADARAAAASGGAD